MDKLTIAANQHLAQIEQNEAKKEAEARARRRKEAQRGYLGTNVSYNAKQVHKLLLKNQANELFTDTQIADALQMSPARVAEALLQLERARLVRIETRYSHTSYNSAPEPKRVVNPHTDRTTEALDLLSDLA